jgi:hypothetical protein
MVLAEDHILFYIEDIVSKQVKPTMSRLRRRKKGEKREKRGKRR